MLSRVMRGPWWASSQGYGETGRDVATGERNLLSSYARVPKSLSLIDDEEHTFDVDQRECC